MVINNAGFPLASDQVSLYMNVVKAEECGLYSLRDCGTELSNHCRFSTIPPTKLAIITIMVIH